MVSQTHDVTAEYRKVIDIRTNKDLLETYLAMCHGPEKERSSNPDYEFVRDYSALNKAALEAGMVNAKDQSRFRYVVKLIFHCLFLHSIIHL